jgi:DNA-binding GntR family transcriptional regulator
MPDEHALPASLFMDIDRAGPIPLYYQVASRIESAIADGTVPPGSRIDNEIALGERLGLSRPTIRRAIQELVDKGLLVRRRGIGTQVVHRGVTRKVELTSLYEDLSASSRTPTTRLLQHEIGEADAATAERLGVAEGSPVLHLRRLRLADGAPLALLDNTLPEQFCDLRADELAEFGLYQLLRARGVAIRVARQRIGARAATADEASLLDLGRHAALLTMERTAYDTSARVVEFGAHAYRPDLYSFDVTLVDR